jgi:hypothetical protein
VCTQRFILCSFWIIAFIFGMESTVEMTSEEYEAAKILLSLKYSGNSDTGPQFPSGSCVPIQPPMVMLSPWVTTSALPVTTPYVLWHGKWGMFVYLKWEYYLMIFFLF